MTWLRSRITYRVPPVPQDAPAWKSFKRWRSLWLQGWKLPRPWLLGLVLKLRAFFGAGPGFEKFSKIATFLQFQDMVASAMGVEPEPIPGPSTSRADDVDGDTDEKQIDDGDGDTEDKQIDDGDGDSDDKMLDAFLQEIMNEQKKEGKEEEAEEEAAEEDEAMSPVSEDPPRPPRPPPIPPPVPAPPPPHPVRGYGGSSCSWYYYS